jgi:hypothetical protein
MMGLSRRRWDWLFALLADPRAWWRPWVGALGMLLCGCAAAGLLWNRVTPYSEPDSTDSDATIVLGIDPADGQQTPSTNGHAH